MNNYIKTLGQVLELDLTDEDAVEVSRILNEGTVEDFTEVSFGYRFIHADVIDFILLEEIAEDTYGVGLDIINSIGGSEAKIIKSLMTEYKSCYNMWFSSKRKWAHNLIKINCGEYSYYAFPLGETE